MRYDTPCRNCAPAAQRPGPGPWQTSLVVVHDAAEAIADPLYRLFSTALGEGLRNHRMRRRRGDCAGSPLSWADYRLLPPRWSRESPGELKDRDRHVVVEGRGRVPDPTPAGSLRCDQLNHFEHAGVAGVFLQYSHRFLLV
jgi:hypothetical protein